MKRSWLLIPLLALTVAAQNGTRRPCIAFSSESTSPTNMLAKDPLETAATMSGDFDFYASHQEGCWNVHVISLPVMSGKGKRIGYAVSHTVTNPQNIEVGHALTFGQIKIFSYKRCAKRLQMRLEIFASRTPFLSRQVQHSQNKPQNKIEDSN